MAMQGGVRAAAIVTVFAALALTAACGSTGDAQDATGGASTTPAAVTTIVPAPTTVVPTTLPPTTTTTVPPTTTTTVPPPPSYRSGDSGPEVLAIQQQLTALGYRPGAVDGNFGAATASAVMAFQKREGIGRDGIAGQGTLAQLQNPVGAGPTRSGPGPWIEVDRARQVVFVADATGAVTTLNTSTGNNQPFTFPNGQRSVAVTPDGDFSVFRVVNATEVAPLGTLYRPMYFNGGIALHGSPSVPAYPASHGCIRLSNADADWLWTVAGMGTPVTVHG